MQIKITYVGILNGIDSIWCGFKPENAIITEERQVLYPEKGYILEKDGKLFDSVWLKDGDVKENYIEVESKE